MMLMMNVPPPNNSYVYPPLEGTTTNHTGVNPPTTTTNNNNQLLLFLQQQQQRSSSSTTSSPLPSVTVGNLFNSITTTPPSPTVTVGRKSSTPDQSLQLELLPSGNSAPTNNLLPLTPSTSLLGSVKGIITTGSSSCNSETNQTPGHGRNVHFDALMPYCDYYSFADTFRVISNTPFVYNPLATHTTMRFRNMAFERTATAIPDIQCILFVLFGPEPVAFNMHPVVKRAPYFDVDIVTMNPQRILSILSQKLIVIDRHGFHLVRGTATSESIQTRRGRQTTSLHPNSHETAAVLDYCKSVRNLPQKDRHFMMDGLPSVPLLVEVAPPPKSAAPVSGKQFNGRQRQKSP